MNKENEMSLEMKEAVDDFVKLVNEKAKRCEVLIDRICSKNLTEEEEDKNLKELMLIYAEIDHLAYDLKLQTVTECGAIPENKEC